MGTHITLFARRLGLDIRCFAVDTWEGDQHSGHYGDEVFRELRDFHDPAYGDFSQLLRMRFYRAMSLFSDGEIDLLHIDGLHTYKAVRQDYEAWLPKMSDAGVILFHDTNVPELMLDFLHWSTENSELAHRFFWVQGSDIELHSVSEIIEHMDKLGQQLTHARSIIKERDSQLLAKDSQKTDE